MTVGSDAAATDLPPTHTSKTKMMTRNPADKLLDDGLFFVALADAMAGDRSVGLLERRCAVSNVAPSGHACVGTFIRGANGEWGARLSSEFDPATGRDYLQLVEGVSRLDAIVLLWQSRHSTYVAARS